MRKIFIVLLYRILWDSSITRLVLAPSGGCSECFLVFLWHKQRWKSCYLNFCWRHGKRLGLIFSPYWASSIFSLWTLQSFPGYWPDAFWWCLLWVQRKLLLDACFCSFEEHHPLFVLESCQYGILMVKSHPPICSDDLPSNTKLNTTMLGAHPLLMAICRCLTTKLLISLFPRNVGFSRSGQAVFSGLLMRSPPSLCPPPPIPLCRSRSV